MIDRRDESEDVESIAQFVREQFHSLPLPRESSRAAGKQPSASPLGIILGSGSGQIADSIQVECGIDYASIPGFPQSTALGHRGRLVLGRLGQTTVVAMQGRFHPYEGHPFERVVLPVRLFHALGIRSLFITNAAGGLNPRFRVGDLMAITSHLDLMNLTSPQLQPISIQSTGVPFARPLLRVDESYQRSAVQLARRLGRELNFVIHTGTYCGLLGPNYETRAEIRMLRKLGADAVGMSTIGEVATAAVMNMDVLAISVITNVHNPDRTTATSGHQVIDAAKVAEPHLLTIVQHWAGKHGD